MTDPTREIDIDMFATELFPEKMMPGQEPYTDAERKQRDELVAAAALDDPGEQGEIEMAISSTGQFQKARQEHEQMLAGVDPAAPEGDRTVYERTPDGKFHPRQVTPTPIPVAMIYGSRTGGETPHVVTLALWRCNCEAAVLGNRDCWAITEAKRLFEGAR